MERGETPPDPLIEKIPSGELLRFLNPEFYFRMMDSADFFVYGYDEANRNVSVPDFVDWRGEPESRTILVSNCPEELDSQCLYSLANGIFGEVAQFEPLSDRRTVSIRFHDLRSARMMRMCIVRYRSKFLQIVFGSGIPVVNRKQPPNNGTLVVFHLPPEITDAAIRAEFGRYGEIRQVRGTPHKPWQRFIEFWDARNAEAAMKEGRQLFHGRIVMEFSLPNGFSSGTVKGLLAHAT
jgi:hypothetical protein